MRPPRPGAAWGAPAVAALAGALACASAGHLPAPEGGVAVEPQAALEFHRSAREFYSRLIERRFNTLETFGDPVLREHFSSLDGFFDYYANLAEALSEAYFEKSRPQTIEIQEFLFEDAEHVRVQVRFVGQDRRPLRPDRTEVVRQDQWIRSGGSWRLVPGFEGPGQEAEPSAG